MVSVESSDEEELEASDDDNEDGDPLADSPVVKSGKAPAKRKVKSLPNIHQCHSRMSAVSHCRVASFH